MNNMNTKYLAVGLVLIMIVNAVGMLAEDIGGEADDNRSPPAISNIDVIDRTAEYRMVIVCWDTEVPATSQVEYGKTHDYGSNTTLDEELVTQHSVDLNYLEIEATYLFRVKSKNEAGEEAISKCCAFSTACLEEVTVNFTGSTYESATGKTSGWFHTGQDADIMLSGIDFNNTGGPLLFNRPGRVASDGTRLLLADCRNNRILIWNSLPVGNTAPDIVLGQEDFYSNNPGTGMNQMNWPMDVATDGEHVVVADTENNRILIWNTFPSTNGQSADLVIEGDVGISDPKRIIRWPWGVWAGGGKLVISSTKASSVLIWNDFPIENNQSADIYLTAQGDFGTPRGIVSDGVHLIVGDDNPCGTFFWSSFPTNDDQPYDFFISDIYGQGQGDFTSDGKLVLLGEGRFHIWNSFPENSSDLPDLSVGEGDGKPGYRFKKGDGSGVVSAGDKLYLSLSNNNNIVGFNSLPTESMFSPDFAVGAPDICTNTLETNYFITSPAPVSDGVSLFVSSDMDRRLYVWKNLPDESNAKPDIVYNLPFQPWDSALFGNTLILTGQNTVCIWETLPHNGELPDIWFNGSIGNVSFQDLKGVALDSQYFYLADHDANKIYVWRGIPDNDTNPKFSLDIEKPRRLSSDGTYLVVASPLAGGIKFYRIDEISSSVEYTFFDWNPNLNLPEAVLAVDGHLFIADTCHSRVLVWSSISDAVTGSPPDVVLGEEDFNDTIPEIGVDKLFWPATMTFDGSYLWVGEFKFSGRLLRFSPTSLVTVSGEGFEVTYENVTYESTWPIERWIKRNIVVRSTSSENLELESRFFIHETGQETEPWELYTYLEPGESENISYFLDVSWRTGLTPQDMETAADYNFTVTASVWPKGNQSVATAVTLYHLVYVVPVANLTTNSIVQGHVYDNETGNPMTGVDIILKGADSIPEYITTSAGDGSYSLACHAYRYLMSSEHHKYNLAVQSPGYKPVHKVLEPVESGTLQVEDIYLEKLTTMAYYELVDNYQTNLTIYRGDVTPDEQRFVISQGHVEMDLTEEEIRNRSRIYLFDMSGNSLNKLWDYPIGDEAWDVDISDDGKYVAAPLTYDGKVILLNENGTLLWEKDLGDLPGDPTNPAYKTSRSVRISHNNKYVAVAAGWGWLYLLDLPTGDLVWWKFVEGHIREMEFSEDDQHIYAGSGNGLCKIDINGNLTWCSDIETWPMGLAVTQDESLIATSSKIGKLYLTDSDGNTLWYFDTRGGMKGCAISPDKNMVVASSGGPFSTTAFDREGDLLWFLNWAEDSVMFTSDGKYILMGASIVNLDGSILWFYPELQPGGAPLKHFSYITRDNSKIVMGDGDGNLYLFEGGITDMRPNAVTLNQPTNITANSMLLSWSQNMDDDFANYTIYQSTAERLLGDPIHVITDNTTTSYNVISLSSSTIYYFTARVYDTGGLYTDSNQVNGTTLAAGDTSPPVIKDVQAVPGSQEIGGYVNIMCTVTDNAGVNIVKVNITYPNGEIKNITMMKVGSDTYSYNASYSVLGTYSYYIWSDDISNKQNKSAVYMFEIYTSNLQPTAVVLNPPTDITTNSIQLSWSQNTDSDFSNYTVYQSTSEGVFGNPICVITDSTATSYNVTDLSPSITYYFTIMVYDTGGLYNDSNQVSGTTLTVDLVIVNITVVGSLSEDEIVSFSVEILNKIVVTPESSGAAKDVYVELWVDDEYVGSSTHISLIYSNHTAYTIIPWKAKSGNHTLRFVVCAEDDINLDNNEYIMNVEVSVDLPLTAVMLNTPTEITTNSMLLSWFQNNDSDFSNYTIYQSTTSGDIGTSIHTIMTQSTTSYTVTGFSPSTTYYFIVVVYDTGGLCNNSNQVSGTTLTEATTGDLTGTVTDKNGNPIEGVTVSIVATSHVTWTDSNGRYTFTDVSASSYGVKAEKSGYETKTETGVVINAGKPITLNIVLEKEKKPEEKGFIPGFEVFILIIIFGGCAILLKHRERLK